jgi:hypothetical protein
LPTKRRRRILNVTSVAVMTIGDHQLPKTLVSLPLRKQIVLLQEIMVIDSMVVGLLCHRILDLLPQLLIMRWIGQTERKNVQNVVLRHRWRIRVLQLQLPTLGGKENNKIVNVLRDMMGDVWMEMIEEEDNNLDVIWDPRLLPTLASPRLWRQMEIMYQLKWEIREMPKGTTIGLEVVVQKVMIAVGLVETEVEDALIVVVIAVVIVVAIVVDVTGIIVVM